MYLPLGSFSLSLNRPWAFDSDAGVKVSARLGSSAGCLDQRRGGSLLRIFVPGLCPVKSELHPLPRSRDLFRLRKSHRGEELWLCVVTNDGDNLPSSRPWVVVVVYFRVLSHIEMATLSCTLS